MLKLSEVKTSPRRYVICKDFTLLKPSMRFRGSDTSNVATLIHEGCGNFLGGISSLTALDRRVFPFQVQQRGHIKNSTKSQSGLYVLEIRGRVSIEKY